MQKLRCLLCILFSLPISLSYAQKGKDGAKVISAANTIVNEYTSLTADAATGNTSLKVSNSALNANSRFGAPLAKGDLILIIQVQGATINGAPTDSTWGEITNYNNCGAYEFSEVSSVPDAATINLNCSLKNNYTATGKVVVVRVPRYSSLTVNSGGILTCDAWNGTQGGIVVTEVQGSTTVNAGGSIDVTGLGFRGGAVHNVYGGSSYYLRNDFASTDQFVGGEKGESIAGYQTDYNAFGGMFGRGAPANGGGGGNAWNCAGGGGGNAGNTNGYTGNGNPDITTNPAWATAWNLEYNGFATSTSSGGGRGGYAVGGSGPDPYVTGPGDAAWSVSFFRNNAGGKGGRPLDYSAGRIFMGGGGGSANMDDNYGGGGGNGGGIIYLLSYGTVSGSGNLTSNGIKGQDANCPTGGNGDPPGGGGAGGTIILNSTGAISGVSIASNGGIGGSQFINNTGGESEGAGGGGGGGYIAVSNGAPSRTALGGINGTTNSISLVKFPPNGGTMGGDGLANETISGLNFSSIIADAGLDATICNGQSVTLNGSGGDSTTTYTWSPALGLSSTVIAAPVANPTNTTQYVLTASNSSCSGKDSMILTVLPKVVVNTANDTSICIGELTVLNPGGATGYTYSWSPADGLSCTNCVNPIANPTVTTTYTVIATNQYCSDTDEIVVQLLPPPTLSLNDTAICFGQSTTLFPVTNGTLTWSPASGLSCTSCNNPSVTVTSETTYYATATLGNCSVTDSVKIFINRPTVSAGKDTTVFSGSKVTLHGSGTQSYHWLPENSVSDADTATPYTTPVTTATYTVTGYDAQGCTATDEVVVIVEDPCQLPMLPNAFSPNRDGKNDAYALLNSYVDKLLEFSIYNRWGQLVFRTTNLNIGWDGNFNGEPEPVGVYVYYLRVDCMGKTNAFKGNFTLLR